MVIKKQQVTSRKPCDHQYRVVQLVRSGSFEVTCYANTFQVLTNYTDSVHNQIKSH